MPSTIETIDTSFYEWVNQSLNISVTTNKGWEKVPVLWLTAERAFQVKNNKELRDSVGKLRLPLITVNRASITKDPRFKGAMQAHFPDQTLYPGDYKGRSIQIARRIKQDKTRNFANKDKAKRLRNGDETGKYMNKKIVYDEYYVPTPVYMNVSYTITLRTENELQMNDLLAPFIKLRGNSPSNSFFYTIDNHRYEAFIDSTFNENQNSTNLSEEERMFETKVLLKVLGYITSDGVNRNKPKVTKRETVVEVKISRERVISGDKVPWKKKDNKYRR